MVHVLLYTLIKFTNQETNQSKCNFTFMVKLIIGTLFEILLD